jgi:hypothetical protein
MVHDHPADLADAPEQPLDAKEIAIGILCRHGHEERTLAAAEINVQRRSPFKDVTHLCPGKVIRRSKLDPFRWIWGLSILNAKSGSHWDAADTRAGPRPQAHFAGLVFLRRVIVA